MKMMHLLLLIVNAFSCFGHPDYSDCPTASEKAKRTVEYFLTLDDEDLEAFRIESGTQNVSAEQVQLVSNPIECTRINGLIQLDSDLQEDEVKFEKCFYKTQNHYYIVYTSRSTRLGYTTIIVLDSIFSVKGVYAI